MSDGAFIVEATQMPDGPCPGCGVRWVGDSRVHDLDCEYFKWLERNTP